MEEPDVLQRLSDWLARRDPDRGRPTLTALGKPGSGYSAENLVIGARWDDGSEEKLVLRRDTSEPPIYPAQSAAHDDGVILQHSVMDALRRGGRVPVADSLGLETDPGGPGRTVLRHGPRGRGRTRRGPPVHPERILRRRRAG